MCLLSLAYITIAIQLQYGFDEKIDVFIFLASNWKQARAIRRSRIVVESQL